MPAARAKGLSNVRNLIRLGFLFTICLSAMAGAATDAAAEQRLALVVGQGAYPSGQLPTTVNDAGLIAQTLTGAGFEVIQGRDLNATDLRRVVRDFLDKAQVAEPDAAVVVYLSGYGIQLEGENYLLPVDARIEREADVPLEGFRLSDLVRSLAGAPAQTRIIVADMGRDYPLPSTGEPIAKGLALMEPPAGFLLAFSSAPNIPVIDQNASYGAYATALVEMIRQPGVRVEDVFARTRLRTHEATNGTQTPWHAANLSSTFVFFEPDETASAEPPVQQPVQERRIDAVSPEEAYSIAVERDTIQDYQEFLRRYSGHPLARRVTAILASRREALVWRRTLNRNSSEAYWTYLRRYRNGPHAPDARRRLARLSAPIAPPAAFEEVIYDDLPPPLPVETTEVVEVVTIIRDAPPPPRAPVYLLPERDYDDDYGVDVISEPPPPPMMAGILPVPIPIPIPVRARPPRMYYQPIAPITPSGPVAIPVAPPPPRSALPPGAAGGPRGRPGRLPPGQSAVPGQPGMLAPAQPLPVAAFSGPTTGPRPAGAPRLPSQPIPLSTQGWAQPGAGVAPQPAAAPQPAPAAAPQPAAPRQALPTPPAPAAPPGAIPGWSGPRSAGTPPEPAPGQP